MLGSLHGATVVSVDVPGLPLGLAALGSHSCPRSAASW